MAKTTKKPEVRIILAETKRVQAGDRLFVTIDPQWADYIVDVQEALFELGVHAAVFPLPAESVQFFAIEERVEVRMDPALLPRPEAATKQKKSAE